MRFAGRMCFGAMVASAAWTLPSFEVRGQDVPGIEICTAERDMVRRTSCLQSNVNFLQAQMSKEAAAARRHLEAANRQIEELRRALTDLEKTVNELKKTPPKAESEKVPR